MASLTAKDWETIDNALDMMADWYFENEYSIYADSDDAPARYQRMKARLMRIGRLQDKIAKAKRASRRGTPGDRSHSPKVIQLEGHLQGRRADQPD